MGQTWQEHEPNHELFRRHLAEEREQTQHHREDCAKPKRRRSLVVLCTDVLVIGISLALLARLVWKWVLAP